MKGIGEKVGKRIAGTILAFFFAEAFFVIIFFFYFSLTYRFNIEGKTADFALAVTDADDARYALSLRQSSASYKKTLALLEDFRQENSRDVKRISMINFGSTNNYYIYDTGGNKLGEKLEYDDYLESKKSDLLNCRKKWRRPSLSGSTLYIPVRTVNDKPAGYMVIEMNDPMPVRLIIAAAVTLLILWLCAVFFIRSAKKKLEDMVFKPVRSMTELTDSFIEDVSDSSARLADMEVTDEIGDLKDAILRLFVNISNGNEDLSEALYKANHDAMTGLLNKRSYNALEDNFRHEKQLCVIYFDVNNLKHVNDNLGHEAGDHIIKQAAEYIRSIMNPSDYCFRMGGDEFLLVMTGCNFRMINKVAERLEADSPYILNPVESRWKSALSYGYAYIEGGDTYDDILGLAEMRMYICKAKFKALMQMPER